MTDSAPNPGNIPPLIVPKIVKQKTPPAIPMIKPKTLSIVVLIALLRCLYKDGFIGPVIIYAFFNLVAEVTDKTLDRPSRRVAKGANGMAFDLF